MPATSFITPEEAMKFSEPDSSVAFTVEERALYAAIVGGVCEAMEQRMRRQIVARPTTKTFDGGCGRLRLPHVAPGVLTVTSVTEKGLVLTAGTDYLVYAEEGSLARLSGANTAGMWAPGLQTVAVAFTAGVAADATSVPENLKLCAKIAFKFYRRNADQDFGKAIDGGSFISPDQFPRQCLFLMDPYKVGTA